MKSKHIPTGLTENIHSTIIGCVIRGGRESPHADSPGLPLLKKQGGWLSARKLDDTDEGAANVPNQTIVTR